MNRKIHPRKINAGVINTPTLIRSDYYQTNIVNPSNFESTFFLTTLTALKRGLDLQITYSRPFRFTSDSLDGVLLRYAES